MKRVNVNNIYFGFDLLNLDLLTKKGFSICLVQTAKCIALFGEIVESLLIKHGKKIVGK